jgi:tripartite-type tricarboxylate transporter receptor subunit TctC
MNRPPARYGQSALAALAIVTCIGASAQPVSTGARQAASTGSGQAYPNKPVRFMVPFPPGAGVDIVARQIAQKMADQWGTAVVIDNRAGAGGVIAVEVVANARPDGYTLLMGNLATQALNPSLYKSLPYDPVRSFSPITQAVSVPEMLVVNAALPVQSVKDLVALAKAKPGQINYGSAGIGSMPHLSGELFDSLAKVDTTHVAYKGNPQATTDLLGGQVQMLFANVLSLAPHVKAGKVKGLAVTSAQRLPSMPSMPTMIEAGVPGYEATNWYGVLAPAGVPRPIVQNLHAAVLNGLKNPELKARLEQDGAEVVGSTPAEFAAHIKREMARWAAVIKQAKIEAR